MTVCVEEGQSLVIGYTEEHLPESSTHGQVPAVTGVVINSTNQSVIARLPPWSENASLQTVPGLTSTAGHSLALGLLLSLES